MCDVVGLLSDGELLLLDTPANLRRAAFEGEVRRRHVSTVPCADSELDRLDEHDFVDRLDRAHRAVEPPGRRRRRRPRDGRLYRGRRGRWARRSSTSTSTWSTTTRRSSASSQRHRIGGHGGRSTPPSDESPGRGDRRRRVDPTPADDRRHATSSEAVAMHGSRRHAWTHRAVRTVRPSSGRSSSGRLPSCARRSSRSSVSRASSRCWSSARSLCSSCSAPATARLDHEAGDLRRSRGLDLRRGARRPTRSDLRTSSTRQGLVADRGGRPPDARRRRGRRRRRLPRRIR